VNAPGLAPPSVAAGGATIRVRGVGKSFQRARVLDGLDLDVAAGDRIALVGANGAGKTTLIRCLLGEYVHEGVVEIDGLAPRAHRSEVLRRVGFVPQLPPPLRMPVGQLLGFAADVCRTDPAPMEAVATRLGLDARSVWTRPFSKLSGGQKQKLLIAVALGRRCDLLILDEPAANLDPQARGAFFELLAEREPRTTMLLSSHRVDEVAALVQRVVELDHGAVVLDDRVVGAGRLDARVRCRVVLTRPVEAASHALGAWGLATSDAGQRFEGTIAGADRLRFLGALARYAGLLREVDLREENGHGERDPR
jgi:ABC-2 type transport system ATP-binding protein